MIERLIDSALDRAVVPGYSRFGLEARRRLGTWPADPPRMDGKLVLVTGASAGLGRAAAAGLARLGADVRVLTRDRDRSAQLARDLAAETGGQVKGVTCDVSDLASVRRFTGRFAAAEARLDVLINNAGVMPPERTETADGVELTFATHVLGPHVLIERLSPLLKVAAPSRVINVSSGGMYSKKLDIDDLQSNHGAYRKNAVYAKTKRAQVILTHEWARRLEPTAWPSSRCIRAGPTPRACATRCRASARSPAASSATPTRAPTPSSGWPHHPTPSSPRACSGTTAARGPSTTCR